MFDMRWSESMEEDLCQVGQLSKDRGSGSPLGRQRGSFNGLILAHDLKEETPWNHLQGWREGCTAIGTTLVAKWP